MWCAQMGGSLLCRYELAMNKDLVERTFNVLGAFNISQLSKCK